MTNALEDIQRELAEAASRHTENVEQEDEQNVDAKINRLRANVQSFLDQSPNKKERRMRERALASAIYDIANEANMCVADLASLLFPEKAAYFERFNQEPISDFGKEPFFEHLRLLDDLQWKALGVISDSKLFKTQPYAEDILTKAAQISPLHVIKRESDYSDQSYAARVIKEAEKVALEKSPGTILVLAKEGRSFSAEVIEKAARDAAERDAEAALEYVSIYQGQSYAPEVIEKAARNAAKNVPGIALQYAPVYQGQSYAPEVIEKAARNAATKDYKEAMYFVSVYADQPYAEEVFREAARKAGYAAAIIPFINKNSRHIHYVAEVLERAVRSMVEKEPEQALEFSRMYEDEWYGPESIQRARNIIAGKAEPKR